MKGAGVFAAVCEEDHAQLKGFSSFNLKRTGYTVQTFQPAY